MSKDLASQVPARFFLAPGSILCGRVTIRYPQRENLR